MLKARPTVKFCRELKLAKKRGLDAALLERIIDILLQQQPLPPNYRDHPLRGNYAGLRECHISGDWLFIYQIKDGVLVAHRTGTHSDLF